MCELKHPKYCHQNTDFINRDKQRIKTRYEFAEVHSVPVEDRHIYIHQFIVET